MKNEVRNFNVIAAIGKKFADYRFKQEEVLEYMKQEYNNDTASRKLAILSRQSGILHRHSIVPDFSITCEKPELFINKTKPELENRMLAYKGSALKLATGAIDNAFEKLSAKLQPDQITHILTVSCTGLYAPGLSTQLIEHYSLSDNTFHTGINFMGCNASFPALRFADLIVKSDSKAVVVVVCVEICTIHFQPKDNNDNLLANSLFADGSGAMVIISDSFAKSKDIVGPELRGFSTLTLNTGKDLMGWDVNSINFEMILSPEIPGFIGSNLPYIAEKLKNNFQLSNLESVKWAIHPGGKKILDEFISAMKLNKDDIKESYHVLSEFGNMSSVTIIYVLDEILSDGKFEGPLIEMGFGPGISIESAFLYIPSVTEKA
jgi:predicted naringenin-chalcone synthase